MGINLPPSPPARSCANGIPKSASRSSRACARTRPIPQDRSQLTRQLHRRLIKAERPLVAGGKFLFKCLPFLQAARKKIILKKCTMCLSRHGKGAERSRQQRAAQQVAELEYSLLVMSYLNSESILPGITQKCDSGQHGQKLSGSFCLGAQRFSPWSRSRSSSRNRPGPGKSFPASV